LHDILEGRQEKEAGQYITFYNNYADLKEQLKIGETVINLLNEQADN